MVLFGLPQHAPAAVSQRLDEIAPSLEKSMKGAAVTKDTVKQDFEHATELQRSTLRAVVALCKVSGSGGSPKFDKFVAEVRMSSQWAAEFKDLQGV
jgi:cullin-associated NEDD8-dissociated protein 1